MKATVVEIQSKYFLGPNPDRTISLQFEPEKGRFSVVRLPESSINIVGLALDDELEVSFAVTRPHWTTLGEEKAKA